LLFVLYLYRAVVVVLLCNSSSRNNSNNVTSAIAIVHGAVIMAVAIPRLHPVYLTNVAWALDSPSLWIKPVRLSQ